MTLTRLIGDIHGAIYEYKSYAIDKFEGPTIQLGDFGIGFGQGDYWLESIEQFHAAGNHRFIRGNHDHPALCKTLASYIPDGRVENDVMYVGGAWSIDNPTPPPGWRPRTKDYDWWEDEECSEQDFERLFDIYVTVKPRVMITHDCPHDIATAMFWDSGILHGPRYATRTSTALQRMFNAHQPDQWYFGHWHHSSSLRCGNTQFRCLGILDHIDVDL